jgi:transposase
MSKSQPTYSKGFKQETVRLFETSGKSKTQIARDFGISDSTLSKWCKEFGELGKETFPGKGHQIPIEEENRKLKRENEILKQEREILKKRWASSRSPIREICVHPRASPSLFHDTYVSCARSLRERIL